MVYTDQFSNSIRFCLTEGTFDYSPLTILSVEHVQWNDVSIELGILGESHYAVFKARDSVLNEICACTELIPSPHTQPIILGLLNELTLQTIEVPLGKYSYKFCAEYLDWDRGIEKFQTLETSAKSGSTVDSIQYFFPALHGEAHKPVTKLFLAKGERVLLTTFHTYPNEGIVVCTESTLSELQN